MPIIIGSGVPLLYTDKINVLGANIRENSNFFATMRVNYTSVVCKIIIVFFFYGLSILYSDIQHNIVCVCVCACMDV